MKCLGMKFSGAICPIHVSPKSNESLRYVLHASVMHAGRSEEIIPLWDLLMQCGYKKARKVRFSLNIGLAIPYVTQYLNVFRCYIF